MKKETIERKIATLRAEYVNTTNTITRNLINISIKEYEKKLKLTKDNESELEPELKPVLKSDSFLSYDPIDIVTQDEDLFEVKSISNNRTIPPKPSDYIDASSLQSYMYTIPAPKKKDNLENSTDTKLKPPTIKLRVGSIVELASDSDYYMSDSITSSNPSHLSGEITLMNDPNEIMVLWANGLNNVYHVKDLVISKRSYLMDKKQYRKPSSRFGEAILKSTIKYTPDAFFDDAESFTQPSKRIENVTIGSDFELFLFDKNINEVVNAKPYVKGSKDFPYNFDKTNEFWCTSLDNVLAEMNIPPCINEKEFDQFVEKAIKYVQSTLPSNITTLAYPAMYLKEEYLNTPESREFGCTPSYNAYTLKENPQPSGGSTNLRTGAFHIHIKYDNMDFELSAELIKMLDLYLGLPSLLIEPPNERRKLYGTPGEFRFSEDKTTEYRVLSNFFSKNSTLRSWVYRNTMAGIEHFNTKGMFGSRLSQEIQNTILNGDIKNAERIIDKMNIPLTRKQNAK